MDAATVIPRTRRRGLGHPRRTGHGGPWQLDPGARDDATAPCSRGPAFPRVSPLAQAGRRDPQVTALRFTALRVSPCCGSTLPPARASSLRGITTHQRTRDTPPTCCEPFMRNSPLVSQTVVATSTWLVIRIPRTTGGPDPSVGARQSASHSSANINCSSGAGSGNRASSGWSSSPMCRGQ